eukprot:15615162-Heterocapsa_arctica.AAC.1
MGWSCPVPGSYGCAIVPWLPPHEWPHSRYGFLIHAVVVQVLSRYGWVHEAFQQLPGSQTPDALTCRREDSKGDEP